MVLVAHLIPHVVFGLAMLKPPTNFIISLGLGRAPQGGGSLGCSGEGRVGRQQLVGMLLTRIRNMRGVIGDGGLLSADSELLLG